MNTQNTVCYHMVTRNDVTLHDKDIHSNIVGGFNSLPDDLICRLVSYENDRTRLFQKILRLRDNSDSQFLKNLEHLFSLTTHKESLLLSECDRLRKVEVSKNA